MTKKNFENNVIMAVEIEYAQGGRHWETMKASEVDAYIKKMTQHGDYLSDVDYSTKQDDPEIAEVIKRAGELFWDGTHKFESFNDAIDSLLDDEEKPSEVTYEDFCRLMRLCESYDPFTQYIDDYTCMIQAEARDERILKEFDEIMRKYFSNLKHVTSIPFGCENCCGEELTKNLTAWLNKNNLTVAKEPKEEVHQSSTKRVWTEEEIKSLVQTNDKVLYGALKNLYACQTADEQCDFNTKHQNGAGFNALDAEFLTSVAQFLEKHGFLTDKQKMITRKKLVKYNKQLTRLANA